jgi:2-oxoglutarate dehydrogenase E2 component (dihydrolipoamide succinyltransferase)
MKKLLVIVGVLAAVVAVALLLLWANVGTFTVTNPGVFGSLFGTPIIPQPQVAILGVGTIEKRPVVVTDEQGQDALGIRTVGYLALAFDHRLSDGADADKFMASLKTTLESGEFDLG